MEKCSGERCSGYRGKQTRTISGITCQAWGSQSPHRHIVNPFEFPDVGISGEGNNFCRNTDASSYQKLKGQSKTIWCYTTNYNKRWEYCEPMKVDQTAAIEAKKIAEEVERLAQEKADEEVRLAKEKAD